MAAVVWPHPKRPTHRRSLVLDANTLSMGANNVTPRRTAVAYTMLALVCLFGGPLVNKLGIKWSLVVGAATFPVRGASYYVNSKYGNQWVRALHPDVHFSSH